MSGKLGVVGGLNRFIDDTVDDSEGIEIKLNAIHGSVGNLLVLLVEVVKELLSLDVVDEPIQHLRLTAGP